MITTQIVTSQGHRDHLVPRELLGQEESLDLEEDQDSQVLLGSKDHPVKEVSKFQGNCIFHSGHSAEAARGADPLTISD